MRRRAAAIGVRDGLEPPPQADFAEPGLADRGGGALQFTIEGVERQKPPARRTRREQAGQVAVVVVAAQRRGAELDRRARPTDGGATGPGGDLARRQPLPGSRASSRRASFSIPKGMSSGAATKIEE